MSLPIYHAKSHFPHTSVYPPSEDTFITIDRVLDTLVTNTVDPSIIIEVGSGSGVAICSVIQNLSNTWGLAVDINPESAKATSEVLKLNLSRCKADVILADYTRNIFINDIADIIFSNPPYLEPNYNEENNDLIELNNQSIENNQITDLAWCGFGEKGDLAAHTFAPLFIKNLRDMGCAGILIEQRNTAIQGWSVTPWKKIQSEKLALCWFKKESINKSVTI